MTFFNSKEEVIDIELTPHGKHLLSKGVFKPVYYEFYDDDIIYDYQYGGLVETQSQINSRIKESPRTKVLYSFSDAEEKVKKYLKQIRDRGLELEVLEGSNQNLLNRNLITQDSLAEIKTTLYTNFLPLANSSKISNLYPQIKARFILGEISSSFTSVDLTGLPNNLYSLTLKSPEYKLYQEKTLLQDSPSNVKFKDDTYINVEKEEIFLEISELNTDNLKENFELSLYAIEEVEGQNGETREVEVSLNFVDVQRDMKIINNLLVENPDFKEYQKLNFSDQFNKPGFVNYFLEINTDKEIAEDILCENLPSSEISRLKAVEGYDISCEDDPQRENITSRSRSLRLNAALNLQNEEQ